MKFELTDLRVDTFRTGQPVGGMTTGDYPSAVSVTHMPTGMVEVCDEHRSSFKNKKTAIERLQKRVEEHAGS